MLYVATESATIPRTHCIEIMRLKKKKERKEKLINGDSYKKKKIMQTITKKAKSKMYYCSFKEIIKCFLCYN